jgi:hypothetical protein
MHLMRSSAHGCSYSMPTGDPEAEFATPRQPTAGLRYGEQFYRCGAGAHGCWEA